MITNENPLISILTVSYNSEKTIGKTIQSVLDQTYNHIEYIIIDGASTDSTLDIIKKSESQFIERNITYKYISEPDKGIYQAMNKGIACCNGDLIGIINSDDWYETNAVQEIAFAYSQNKDYDIFHGVLMVFDENNSPKHIIGHYSQFLSEGMIEHPTCFVKRNCYHTIGDFDTSYRSAADYEWMLRARAAGLKFLFTNRLIANFRLGGISESKSGFLEDFDIKKKYGLLSTLAWTYKRQYLNLSDFIKRIIKYKSF